MWCFVNYILKNRTIIGFHRFGVVRSCKITDRNAVKIVVISCCRTKHVLDQYITGKAQATGADWSLHE